MSTVKIAYTDEDVDAIVAQVVLAYSDATIAKGRFPRVSELALAVRERLKEEE
jgi:hypothetical protein